MEGRGGIRVLPPEEEIAGMRLLGPRRLQGLVG
jgi:hypothetical protein